MVFCPYCHSHLLSVRGSKTLGKVMLLFMRCNSCRKEWLHQVSMKKTSIH